MSTTNETDKVRETLQSRIPVIRTEEQFRETNKLFRQGGVCLAMGFLPEQKEVLTVLFGLHAGMMESPFTIDDDGNVVRKPNAEPTPAPAPLDLTLVPDPQCPPAPAKYPAGDFEPVLTGGRYA